MIELRCSHNIAGLVVVLGLGFVTVSGCTDSGIGTLVPPYPPSPVVKKVVWDSSTHIIKAPGSDNWPATWADDDHLYTAWGDGGGFGGTNREGRTSLGVARVDGTWDNYEGFNIWGGKDAVSPAQFKGKSYGILSQGGVLFMWVMVEGSYYRQAQIAWSADHGRKFHRGFKFAEPDAAFSVPTFLNFGKDYEGARDNYVYVYSGLPPDGCTSRCVGKHVDMARVPKDEITNRRAYEFFGGLGVNGHPRWTFRISERQPVFIDRNGAATRFGVVYNPGIRRYILTIAHDNEGGLGIFDAPEPWGPWTMVAYYEDWLGFGYSPSYHIAPAKWMSRSGKHFTIIWSSNDQWNTMRGTFSLKSS